MIYIYCALSWCVLRRHLYCIFSSLICNVREFMSVRHVAIYDTHLVDVASLSYRLYSLKAGSAEQKYHKNHVVESC